MTPRQNRMVLVALIVVGAGTAAALGLRAFDENMQYYVTPSELTAQANASEKSFRIFGMVKADSVERATGSMTVRFVVTDYKREVPVAYTGVLPDLFREGQGVVALGKFSDGVFAASEINAKHDENYMPAEMAEKIKAEHGGKMPAAKP